MIINEIFSLAFVHPNYHIHPVFLAIHKFETIVVQSNNHPCFLLPFLVH